MSASDITKRAISEAFLELLNEKPFAKISVKDISERCGVNRNTFYYHYQDIQSLLEELCAHDVDTIMEQYPELNSIEQCLEALMQFARSHKKAALHIYNSDSKDTFVASTMKLAEHVVSNYVNTVFVDSPISDYDKMLVIRYFTCSLFGITIDWLRSGLTEEYVEGAKKMIENSKGVAELIISNCMNK